MVLLTLALMIQQTLPVTTASSAEKCTPQPMPRAIDISPVELSSQKIEFAATPALEYPGGAWVIRLWRRGTIEVNVEILKLRRQVDCNRYDVINVWRSKVTQDEYADIAYGVVTFGVPDRSVFAPPYDASGISLDGTQIDLRLENSEWRVDHRTNLGDGRNAHILSEIFQGLIAKYVPASERPSRDWRRFSKKE